MHRHNSFSCALYLSFFRSLGSSRNGVMSKYCKTNSTIPWALAFLPDNHGMLITLRGGELRHWQAGKDYLRRFRVPDVWAHGQKVCWTWF